MIARLCYFTQSHSPVYYSQGAFELLELRQQLPASPLHSNPLMPSAMIRIPSSSRLLSTSLRPSLSARAHSLRPGCRSLATTAGSSNQSQQDSPVGSGQKRSQQHAVSNPTLANIEKRWEVMPPQEQAELWMALRDRMTVDWHEMTMQEKRACEFISSVGAGTQSWR